MLDRRSGAMIAIVGLLIASTASVGAQGPLCDGVVATIVGTDGDDVIEGTQGDDVIVAGPGDDIVHGGPGDDIICGGAGSDLIEPGTGRGRSLGGAGRDTVSYATVDTSRWLASAQPGSGGVTVDLERGRVSGQRGLDQRVESMENVIGTDRPDTLLGDAGRNELDGRAGVVVLNGRGRRDLVVGGSGFDYVSYQGAPRGVRVDLRARAGRGWGRDTLVSVEAAYGSRHRDVLLGSSRDDRLEGFGGDDLIDGRAGNDTLLGGAGSDEIYGRRGSDSIRGGGRGDTIYGGSHRDIIEGQGGNDHLFGGPGSDAIAGQDGIDVIDGGPGLDDIHYGGFVYPCRNPDPEICDEID